MKYKLGKTHPDNPNLRRVIALKDIPLHDVSAGDEGGYIEREGNLSQQGDCWVGGDARVSGNARVFGNAWVSGNARVFGNAWVYGDAWVEDGASVSDYARVEGDAAVFGDARVGGDAQVYGYARVLDNARVYGNASVFGDAQVFGYAQVSGNVRVYGGALADGYDDHRHILKELKKHNIPRAEITYSGCGDSCDVDEVLLDGPGPESLRKLCGDYFNAVHKEETPGFESNEGVVGRLIVDVKDERIWLEHYWNTEAWGELKVVKVMACEDLAIKAQAFDATEVCAEFSAEEVLYVYMTRGRRRLSGQPGSEEFLLLFEKRINQILENGNDLFLSDDGRGEVTLIVDEGVIEFKWAERETDQEHETIEVYCA